MVMVMLVRHVPFQNQALQFTSRQVRIVADSARTKRFPGQYQSCHIFVLLMAANFFTTKPMNEKRKHCATFMILNPNN